VLIPVTSDVCRPPRSRQRTGPNLSWLQSEPTIVGLHAGEPKSCMLQRVIPHLVRSVITTKMKPHT
jgi:hypothetical protein